MLGLGQWPRRWRESSLSHENHFGSEVDGIWHCGDTEGPLSSCKQPPYPPHAPAPMLPPSWALQKGWASSIMSGAVAPPPRFVTLGSCQPLPRLPNCEMGPTELEAGRQYTPSSLLRSFCPPPLPPLPPHTHSVFLLSGSEMWLQAHEAVRSGCSSFLPSPSWEPGSLPRDLPPLFGCSHQP